MNGHDPGEMTDTGPDGESRTSLWRAFAVEIVEDALAEFRAVHPGVPEPPVDWERIWAADRGAISAEQAVGRVVLAASLLAAEVEHATTTGTFRQIPGPSSRLSVVAEAPPALDIEHVATPRNVHRHPEPSAPVTVEHRVPDVAPVFSPVRPFEFAEPPVLEDFDAPAPVTIHREPPPARRVGREVRRGPRVHRSRRQRLATAFAWVRNVGVIILLFAAWQVWGTGIQQSHAQRSLKIAFEATLHHNTASRVAAGGASPTTTTSTLIPASVAVPVPAQGTVVAHLRIPAIGLDQYVVQGTAESDLSEGPGHYAGTAMPGQHGNVGIAGHRTTFGAPFGNLDKLVPGDSIWLTSDAGVNVHYVVRRPPTAVAPNDVGVLGSFGDDRLTLTTCTPKFSAAQRLIAVAYLVQSQAHGRTPTSPTSTVPSSAKPVVDAALHRALSTSVSGWNLSRLPLVGVLVLAMIVLGLVDSRLASYLGRRARWIIVAPVWIAALYVLFGQLTALLPTAI